MVDALHVASGKVRELYEVDADRLLLVASDRISAFDVVLPTLIPDKGRVLTGLAAFWFVLLAIEELIGGRVRTAEVVSGPSLPHFSLTR